LLDIFRVDEVAVSSWQIKANVFSRKRPVISMNILMRHFPVKNAGSNGHCPSGLAESQKPLKMEEK